MHYLEPPARRLSLDLETWLFGMRVAFKPAAAEGVTETYQLRIDGVPGYVVVREEVLEGIPGEAKDSAVTITTTTPILLALTTRQLSAARALAEEAVKLHGSRSAFLRFINMFELPAPDRANRRR